MSTQYMVNKQKKLHEHVYYTILYKYTQIKPFVDHQTNPTYITHLESVEKRLQDDIS